MSDHSTTKMQVTDKIFNLILIHAPMIVGFAKFTKFTMKTHEIQFVDNKKSHHFSACIFIIL